MDDKNRVDVALRGGATARRGWSRACAQAVNDAAAANAVVAALQRACGGDSLAVESGAPTGRKTPVTVLLVAHLDDQERELVLGVSSKRH